MPAVQYRPRYTIEDYMQWEGDWELWDGVPVSMSPSPNRPHQRIGMRITSEIDRALEAIGDDCDQCEVLYEIDYHIGNHTVVRPDALITCEGKSDGGWITRTPVLVAEILSPSTREKDQTSKRDLYQAEGVSHYLIADAERNTLIHLQLGPDGYEERSSDPLVLDLHENRQIEIPLSRIFR